MVFTTILGAVVILVGWGAAFYYPVMQVQALRRMRGIWLILAALPLLPMAYIIIITAFALGKGSNLWPILLIFAAPFGTAYLAILRFAHARLA